ncbi:MAG: bifunctional oligoribonuclease/PAP phosphatase NrnA [Candidatus Omnitrophica bacterium]|nr:bifunctional oligoribonuclease/PAP phosphatase NrnA [Candidatus Omnitrophota bacterium]
MSLEKCVECIRKNRSFLITTHINVEGDALGSELAFAGLLKAKGKKVFILNQDKVPQEYSFLPGTKSVRTELNNFNFDVAAILDCSDLNRSGEIRKVFKKDTFILNIDHHISNSRFAQINWVKPHASSTAEMVYELFKKMRVPLNKNDAMALYAGILTDTGSFRYSNTTYKTHAMAAELLKHGIIPKEVYKHIYQSNTFEDMKVLAGMLSSAERDKRGGLIWFTIPQKVLRQANPHFDFTEHVLSFGRKIKGAEVVALFKENLGNKYQIKVNLRSQGKCDVNKIAKYFGGGGHRSASACTINGRLAVVRRDVLSKIKAVLY